MNELFAQETSEIKESLDFKNYNIRLGTLFSGIGAAEQALHKLGVENEIIFACDNNKHVKKSWQANYYTQNWYDDVKDVANHEVDIIVGGSPCQSFSALGKQLGFKDTRGTLFYEYARVIKESQPKVFIYENVRSLLSHDNKRTFRTMCNIFNELGYDYFVQVLNAKDYGIPQSRNRVFVIGFRKDLNIKDFKFPESIKLTTTAFDYLESVIGESYFKTEKSVYNIIKRSNERGSTKINTEIVPCLTANYNIGYNGYFLGKSLNRIRCLTPRECLRFMGFSDSFEIVVSNAQMYKQCGNSIVSNVLESLFTQIFSYLKF